MRRDTRVPPRAQAAPWSGGLPLALAIFAALAVAGVLLRPLLPVDETRYMSVAWEMWDGGDVLVPHLNGALYPHKPPLLFWLIDLAWWLGGVSETAGRLVGPLAALAAIALTALLGRRLWPEEPGLGGRAALVLATSGVFLVYGSLVMFDALLTAAALTALIAVVEAWRSGRLAWWLLYGLGLGLGVLAKGPVIALHVLPVALLMPLWAGAAAPRPLRRWYLGVLLGVAAGVALVLPWLLPAALVGGADYRAAVLWQQSAGRIVESFAHQQPLWFYLALLPVLLWPWLWWPPLWKALRATLAARDPRLRFCLVWAGAALLLFSLVSGKQLHYLLPELPAVALVVGRALAGLSKAARVRILPALLPVLAALALLLAVARELVEFVGLGPLEDAIELQFPLHAGWLVVAALLLAVIVLAARHWRAVAWVAPLLVALVGLFCIKPLDPFYDGSRFAAALRAHQDAGLAYVGGRYQGEFTFLGRLQAPLVDLHSDAELRAWAAAHPQGAIVGAETEAVPSWSPALSSRYRGRVFGLWIVPRRALADAPGRAPSPPKRSPHAG